MISRGYPKGNEQGTISGVPQEKGRRWGDGEY